MTVIAQNMGLAYPTLVRNVVEHGDLVSPRGLQIREERGFHLVLEDPTRPLVNRRGYNRALMWADILCVLSGTFSPTLYDIASPAATRSLHKASGAYGPRTAQQIRDVVDELRRDPDSRRAVVYVGRDSDLRNSVDTGDQPCTSLWQFFIREGRLEMLTYMRSWDLVWGLSYDLPVFTMVQRLVAAALQLEVGTYQHFAGSAHVYDRHWGLPSELEAVETPELEPPFPARFGGRNHIVINAQSVMSDIIYLLEDVYASRGLMTEDTVRRLVNGAPDGQRELITSFLRRIPETSAWV